MDDMVFPVKFPQNDIVAVRIIRRLGRLGRLVSRSNRTMMPKVMPFSLPVKTIRLVLNSCVSGTEVMGQRRRTLASSSQPDEGR